MRLGARAYLLGSFEALGARRRLEDQGRPVDTGLPKLFDETTDPELHDRATGTHKQRLSRPCNMKVVEVLRNPRHDQALHTCRGKMADLSKDVSCWIGARFSAI